MLVLTLIMEQNDLRMPTHSWHAHPVSITQHLVACVPIFPETSPTPSVSQKTSSQKYKEPIARRNTLTHDYWIPLPLLLMFLSVFFLALFRATFPYANFGVDGDRTSGTLQTINYSGKKKRKTAIKLLETHLYNSCFKRTIKDSNSANDFGKAKEPKLLLQKQNSKHTSVYVCGLAQESFK